MDRTETLFYERWIYREYFQENFGVVAQVIAINQKT